VRISKSETLLLDIPLPRKQKRAFGDFDKVNHLIVRLMTDEGLEGAGEVATCGGPTWSEDCVESAQIVVDRYLAPGLVGQDPFRIEYLLAWMDRVVKGNRFAKAAVESALLDIVGKALKIPVCTLLGGMYHDRLPVAWLLNVDDVPAAIAEAEVWLARGITVFKLKVAEGDPEQELQAVDAIARAVRGKARLRADANGGWDEATAARMIPRLAALGVECIEQPVPRGNLVAMARLVRSSFIPVMADESVYTPEEALSVVRSEAAHAFCLKLAKTGGILATKKMAAIAEAAGFSCVISTMLETSLGCAAALHFAASTRAVNLGCELVGPLFLTGDIVEEPLRYEQGQVLVPGGPGLGVTLDEAKLRRCARRA
jgi:muconate cycloisomerase